MDLLRGIWNFARNPWKVPGGGRPRGPINDVVCGPLTTLHSPDGRLATEDYWYDPEYLRPERPYDVSRDWEKLQRSERSIRRDLNKGKRSNYRRFLEQMLVQYARALDERNLYSAFLSVWQILEQVTATHHANYDRMVRRASFVRSDTSFAEQELMHLRQHRNQQVHKGSPSDARTVETRAYQLKSYVEQILDFLLRRSSKFSTVDEALHLLDSPLDKERIGREIRTLREAKQFRSGLDKASKKRGGSL